MRFTLTFAAGIVVLLAGVFAAPDLGRAQEAVGYVKTVKGTASIVRNGTNTAATLGAQVFRRDTVETGADGMLGLTLNDNSLFSIGPNTKLAVEEFDYDSSTLKGNMLANMLQGTLAVKSGDIARGSPGKMKVKTPFAILGVRGTTFLVSVEEPKQ